MIENLKIRFAAIKDLLALEQVGDALFNNPIKRDRTIEFFQDLRHRLVLAFHKAKVIGMASGFHYVHPDKDPSMFINEVGVTLEFQNQGVGRELVKYFWEYARKIGCQEAWVVTEKSNIPAQRCYLSAGWEPNDEAFIIFKKQANDHD